MSDSGGSDSWSDLAAAEQALLERVFVGLSLGEELHRKARRRGATRLTPAAVFRLACDPHRPLDGETRAALAASPRLGELFDALLRHQPLAMFPRAAAAAGGGEVDPQRSADRQLADGFRIRLIPSRSTEGQTYVTIDVPSGQDLGACSLFILRADAVPQKLSLPAALRGQIQLLGETESDLVAGLRDPTAEIVLR